MPQEEKYNKTTPLLKVDNLHIGFEQENGIAEAVKGISFTIAPGQFIAIVGESGSGKSVTALSLLQLLPAAARVNGASIFQQSSGDSIELSTAPANVIRTIRGKQIAMIFQEPMTSLNPVISCGYQVMESLMLHQNISKREARNRTIELFQQVELPHPEAMINRYPHEISGGQKQRVMIAMAMSCNPALLIADEPTTALDVRVQKNILELIKKLQAQQHMAILFITHDLALVAKYADTVLVMRNGCIVEQGPTAALMQNPQHAYTKALLACRPGPGSKGKRLPVVADFMAGEDEPGSIIPSQHLPDEPAQKGKEILTVQHLEVAFAGKKNWLGKPASFFKAVDDVSFTVFENEIVGLVGESGCGKTTLGRAILQLVKPTAGKILLHGRDITLQSSSQLRETRRDLQIVFQDPYGSLNPRISIGDAIMEPLKVHNVYPKKKQRRVKAISLLEQVNMKPELFDRYPHQFSGGQRQRICIARALALQPSFLIFDESVSALDVSVQAQVLNLVQDLKNQYNFTAIFISHDLSVVHYISDRILVMNKGKIVEEGPADKVMNHPEKTYTKELIEAAPTN